MHLFYTPDISSEIYTLNEDESKHCIRVLRLDIGDTVYLIDGIGGLYTANIIDNHPKHCTLQVVETKKHYGRLPYQLTIALAPTKLIDRTEWFLEKATEIGFSAYIPIITERSERKETKQERLEKIVTSAVKQSIKAYHPAVYQDIKFKEFIQQPFDGEKYIAHCMDDASKVQLHKTTKKSSNILILIGPEGDFSEAEVAMAQAHGFQSISLGNSRLRTETAGLVACHTINLMFDE